jgi:hypothetical protein
MKYPYKILQDAVNWALSMPQINMAVNAREQNPQLTIKEMKTQIVSVLNNVVNIQIGIVYIPVAGQDIIANEDLLIGLIWTKTTGFQLTSLTGAEL